MKTPAVCEVVVLQVPPVPPPPVTLMVTGVEPSVVNVLQDAEPEQVTEVVATPYTPAPPLETRRFEEEGWLVVARPVYVTVELVPPTRAPRDAAPVKGPEKAREVVATLERFAVPLP